MTTLSLPGTASPDAAAPTVPALRRSLRGPVAFGIAVVLLFFAGLGGWAALAPLASAAIAPGVVGPDGSRRTVQHLEGGIIREIRVTDGSRVAVGDPLVVLADIAARATFEQLQTQVDALAALQARLIAEQQGATAIAFPDRLLDAATADAEVADILMAQSDLFETRRTAMESRKSILRQRIAQLSEEITGLRAQIGSQETQLALIEEEIVGVRQLVDQGLERRPRLLALQRQQAEIEGAIAENRAAIARANQTIGEAELQILGLETDRLDEIAAELTDVRTRLLSLEERLRSSRDVLTRTVIEAPVAGTVVALRYKTTGGVIGPGDPILDIVPENEELVIEARVSPVDIDAVAAGQTAQIHLLAYAQRNLPRIEGTVTTVSADALTDEQTGESYYSARVAVDRERLAALPDGVALSAGMPAEVLIMTGERTALAYILQPFLDSLRRSFRET
ncbi:MAG: HlyD family type I secretion periplasmic adaptor subunit [Alphaproteobacteria bacterium]|jgi:HlyD family secretion protein/epimerase transport system membrane fusion protein|nr:HlyD family type I secretion periplasmic adaptor subunit [Alphaproteobacteria bacterium]